MEQTFVMVYTLLDQRNDVKDFMEPYIQTELFLYVHGFKRTCSVESGLGNIVID